MVIIWLMMVNNNLVGGFNPSEKYARQMGLLVATVSGKSVIKFHGSSHYQAVIVKKKDESSRGYPLVI